MSLPAAISAASPAPAASSARTWCGDAGWLMSANLAQAAGPFFAVVLLGRLHGLAAAGDFAYALALTAPIIQLLGFQLKTLVLTYPSNELPLSLAAGIRSFTSIPVFLLVPAFAVLFSPLAGFWLLARCFDSWGELFQAENQRAGRLPIAAGSNLIRSAGLVGFVTVSPSPLFAAGAYCAFSLVLLLTFDVRPFCWTPDFRWLRIRLMLSRGASLGVCLFLQSLSVSFPRIVLEARSDAATLGLFATLCLILQTGNILSAAFGQSLLPRMVSARLREIFTWTLLPVLPALILWLLGPVLRPWLFSAIAIPDTGLSRELFNAVAFTQCLTWPATVIGHALSARRLYRPMLLVAVGIFAASLGSSLILIPTYGAVGAAMSLSAAAAVTILLSSSILIRSEQL